MPRETPSPDPALREARELPIAPKLAVLSSPLAYPGSTRSVETVETHMSWVFLTDTQAWKMKKPLRLDGQDFRSLARRRLFCEEELRVNRRLAAEVYQALVPLTLDEAGSPRIGGQGPVVEWLVQMRRLPADQMLDALLALGTATPQHMATIAARLCVFYGAQPPAPLDAASYVARIRTRIKAAERQLCDPAWQLAASRVHSLCARLGRQLRALRPLLALRVEQGRVVEAHGDLRPEHVWLGEPLAIIDALEFDRRLREQDPADEVGFLAMECEKAGQGWLAQCLLREWRLACADDAPPVLVHFHQACRACDRAVLAIRHLQGHGHEDPLNWRRRTRRYLALAHWHLEASLAMQAQGQEG